MSRLPVTIIIPVYCETEESIRWFEECLHSAHKQNCSVSIYDDGSPLVDNVISIARKFQYDSFVIGENEGVSVARNEAIRFADTDYIFPLDCDDRLVDHAVEQLYDFHRSMAEIPVYPDVRKFGDEDVPHYELLEFSCDNLVRFVGFSSVNVLHRVDQWKYVGGYEESLKFYEDGEYNARLFANFCAARYPHPLVEYRIHANQRTKKYEDQSRKFATSILERIRRLDMPCPGCGGKRKTQSNAPSSKSGAAMSIQQSQSIPKIEVNIGNAPTHLPAVFEGKVLCVYVGGKGRAKHYYQGIATKTPFKVMFGDYLYADPRDVRAMNDSNSRSLLVKTEKEDTVAPLQAISLPVVEETSAPVVEDVVPEVVRSARTVVERIPVEKKRKS